ncbi:aldose 1-epimerase family protein [Konateibacter massiliensis]|uniref:aldose 1-epimerase family protein n=1 Tax=Konateibacter massiliensis TaxID=2002841 RepID=UPI000C14602E|nr:aldose 1-epimerase family protein [Konateibacter massiliensis]
MPQTRQIENERLLLKVNDYGGELAGIYDKKNSRELIWCGDPAVWNRHAPILFPFVGELFNKEYRYENVIYPMTAHGFARDTEFTFDGIKENKIVHSMKSNAKTKKVYPFDFKLEVSHSIVENEVLVEWKLVNTGDKEMLFGIGAHPAFNVPARENEEQKDYYLSFGDKETLGYIHIDKEYPTAMYDTVHTLKLTDGKYKIGEHMFDGSTLIFENRQLSEVGIAFPDKTPYVTVQCEGFPYVGVWKKPGASFICLEPWYGRCDNYGFAGELENKMGVQKLEAKEEFNVSHKIVIH